MGERAPVPGLPKQQEWKVLAVREGKVEPNPKGGELQKFYCDFEGVPDVYWRRKLPATVEVGETYFGTISNGDYGPIFRKESPGGAGGGGGGGGRSGGGGRIFKPESDFDPEKVARMGRAHAQGVAVQTMTAMGTFESKSAEQIHGTLKGWVDWFEADVNAAGEKAKAKAPPPEPSTPAQEQAPPEPVDETTMRNLCQHAGLDSAGATALAGFICERLSDEQKQRAKSGLERDTAATLDKLRGAYEAAEEQALPRADDDIPF